MREGGGRKQPVAVGGLKIPRPARGDSLGRRPAAWDPSAGGFGAAAEKPLHRRGGRRRETLPVDS
jgi:hypothetical protein